MRRARARPETGAHPGSVSPVDSEIRPEVGNPRYVAGANVCAAVSRSTVQVTLEEESSAFFTRTV